MSRFTTRQLAADAILSAICAVLGYLAFDFLNVKISFESVPVLIAALLFGPLDGAAVGLVGTLCYQLLRYGVSATTALWILPYVLCGLVVGWYAKRRGFELTQAQTLAIVICAEYMVTLLNTPVIYLDSRIYGYYRPGIVSGVLLLRLALCGAKAVIYAYALPPLLDKLRRAGIGRRRKGEEK